MRRSCTLLLAGLATLAIALAPSTFAQTAAPTASPPAQPPPTKPPTEPPPAQPTPGDDRDSVEAGKKWLELIDTNKAGAAWDASSKHFQSAVKRDKFVAEMRIVRKPLGKLASRTAVKFARAHDLPGAPSGDYALIEFDAKFTNGKHLSEQLTWSIEEGDVWRVAGYLYR